MGFHPRCPSVLIALILSPLVFSTSACGQSSKDYFPTPAGKSLTYQVTITPGGGREQTGEATVTNMPQRQLRGQSVIPQRMGMMGHTVFEFYRVNDTGVCRVAEQTPGEIDPQSVEPADCAFKAPLRVGTKWNDSRSVGQDPKYAIHVTTTCSINSLDDTQTVPAGTFDHLLKVSCRGNGDKPVGQGFTSGHVYVLHEDTSWYASQIGLVRSLSDDQVRKTGMAAISVITINPLTVDMQLKAKP